MNKEHSGDAVSQVQGVLILVVVTIILAVLLLLMLHIPLWSAGLAPGPPEIFAISELKHLNEMGTLNYDSRMTITHVGTAIYRSDDLRAEILVNEEDTGALINSMNAHLFIPSYHIGVQRLWGPGSNGFYWYPGCQIFLDLTDGTFRQGDLVRLDVYHKDTDQILSRSEMIA
ncbi:hypothetical protein FTO68_10960 [Methanocalculus taiwanensis]|uniref:Archaeal Type IV pilin N-terminal domain-containing protein n=1 Tax=Methanocalculus taiwanensis TaxID=106207 RepID=A0ABD4TKZ4_9EURY|nr:archaellin/type IV pilin N-terminal domain-containing protein [Methanocalculus taiwanensis]MCQ1539496.1 hypothetical protein [Methanocalculus taiwanensis]